MSDMESQPAEVLTHIMSFLSFSDQLAIMRVSQKWYAASQIALKQQKGFVIGSCMGNKPFCSGIRRVGQLQRLSEQAIRVSQYRGRHDAEMESRLSLLCPNVQILCAAGDDRTVTLILLKAFKSTLKYLELDSRISELHEVAVFPVLEYFKCPTLQPNIASLKDMFPNLQYLDCHSLHGSLLKSLPRGLKGLKVYSASSDVVHEVCRSEAKDSLRVLHIITDRATSDMDQFKLPKLTDISVRGLTTMGNLFSSLSFSTNLSKLHVSARNSISVEIEGLLSAFSHLPHLTSLNLRFIILSDPVRFWTRMVHLFAHKLQHLTFSTHFVTTESLAVMSGFAALRSLTMPFIYDQPFLFDNVPEEIRSRQPFSAADLLSFLRAPTASKQTLTDISIQMQSLGTDQSVIQALENELQNMKRNHKLESAEVREVRNRNSIYV